MTIFLLPTYFLRFSVFGLRVNFLDALLGATIFWGTIYCHKKSGFGEFFAKNRALFSLVGLIVAGFLFSIFLNENKIAGLGLLKSLIILPFFFLLVVRLIISQDKVLNIFVTYYFSAFVVSLICLAYYFSGRVTFDLRLQGFFNSPNYLGMYLAPAVFIFPALLSITIKNRKWLVFSSIGIIFWALYLTLSYASWVAILGSLFVVFIVEKKIDWKKISVSLFLLALLVFSQLEKSKFSDLLFFSDQSSFSSRTMIWRSAGKILNDNWFWGIGVGNFQTEYLEYQKYFPPYLEWAVPHPHNLYLAFWLFGGMLGFLGFFALACYWFLCFFKTQKNPHLKFIGLGIMLYILFHGLVDTPYFKNDLAVIFWLLFALGTTQKEIFQRVNR